jgi:hypothetical protein
MAKSMARPCEPLLEPWLMLWLHHPDGKALLATFRRKKADFRAADLGEVSGVDLRIRAGASRGQDHLESFALFAYLNQCYG